MFTKVVSVAFTFSVQALMYIVVQTWAPVKKYIEDHDLCDKEEACLFGYYDPEELENIIETQRKVVEYMKKKKKKNFIRF